MNLRLTSPLDQILIQRSLWERQLGIFSGRAVKEESVTVLCMVVVIVALLFRWTDYRQNAELIHEVLPQHGWPYGLDVAKRPCLCQGDPLMLGISVQRRHFLVLQLSQKLQHKKLWFLLSPQGVYT